MDSGIPMVELRAQHPLDNLLPVPDGCQHSFQFEIEFGDSLGCDWTEIDFQHPSDLFPGLPVTPERYSELATLDQASKLSLAQNWLFYGLLSTFLRQPVRKVDAFGSPNRLGGIRLTRLFHQWHRALCELSEDEEDDEIGRLNKLLNDASDAIDWLDVRPTPYYTTNENTAENDNLASTFLFVRLVVEYLWNLVSAHSYVRCFAIKELHQPDPSAPLNPWFGESLKLVDNAPHAWPADFDVIGWSNRADMFSSILTPDQRPTSTYTATLLQKWFDNNGWCRVTFRSICKNTNYTTTYYLSRIRRLESLDVHERCRNANQCVAYQLTGNRRMDYLPTHTEGCSERDCRLLPEAIEDFEAKLCDMIRKSRIPILSIQLGSAGADLQLIPYDGMLQYTAVSHVWSNGMGNDHHNQVFECQIRRVAEAAANLQEENFRNNFGGPARLAYLWIKKAQSYGSEPRVNVWLDTMCIPARAVELSNLLPVIGQMNTNGGDEDSSDEDTSSESALPPSDPTATERQLLRNMAIRHVTPVFQAAEQVLIIDKEIEKLQNPSQDLLSAILLGSQWMRRAWTYQEGSSARDCRFKTQGNHPAVLRDLRSRNWDISLAGYREDTTDASKSLFKSIMKFLLAKLTLRPMTGPTLSQFWVPLKTVHWEPLNDLRKSYSNSPNLWFVRSWTKRRYEEEHPQTFASAWNHVKQRAATRPSDKYVIFANLLDFDGSRVALSEVVEQSKIPWLLRSSQKIPVSIMFNTETAIYKYAGLDLKTLDRKDLWVPTKIEGDDIAGNNFLQNDSIPSHVQRWSLFSAVKTKVSSRWRKPAGQPASSSSGWLRFDWPPDNLILALTAAPTSYGEFAGPTFAKLTFQPDAKDVDLVVKLCLPHQRLKRHRSPGSEQNISGNRQYGPRVSAHDREVVFQNAQQQFRRSSRVLYMLDISLQSPNVTGYRGRGARFSVVEDTPDAIRLQYDCPLVFQTRNRWDLAQKVFRIDESTRPLETIPVSKITHLKKKDIWIQNCTLGSSAFRADPSPALIPYHA
jgi:hypothetical protein